jgi:hypothetical protein
MSDLKHKYEEQIMGIVDILENLQKVDKVIKKMNKQYLEDKRPHDIFIQQYLHRKKKFEQELYVLLIQLDAPSDIFNIHFNAMIEDIVEKERDISILKESIQFYLQKIEILFAY